MFKFRVAASLLLGSAGAVQSQNLVCEGVLGNSGEAGKTLVRFAAKEATGIGVVADRFGSLWDRAGLETLNRYATDGRLLAQYRIPKGTASASGQDKIALVGDLVVLKLDNDLYSLPVDAPVGTAVKNLSLKATRLSSNEHNGWMAAANDGEIFLFNPATGEKKPAATLPNAPHSVEIGPKGALYSLTRGEVNPLADPTEDWPKKFPGERLQWLDSAWWGNAYHGTIYRYDDTFSPAPGVVLGGASGSFIGHLDKNTELNNGRGLALVRPELFAASGWNGVLHLLQWQQGAGQLQIVRRIGAVPSCRSLALDRAGNVWWHSGSWKWSDGPDAPLLHGVNAPNDKISPAVMLPNDAMLAVAPLGDKAAFYRGSLTSEIDTDSVKVDLGRQIVATATYTNSKKERFLLALNPNGEGRCLQINADGRFLRDAGTTLLQTASPIKVWTSLAMKDENTLLGAGDGHLIELARDGDNWKETARWNNWGENEKFGPQIWISTDADRLWVADRQNHRILCFDPATRQLLASFGGEKGDDLMHLDAPETLTARGERAVVFDSGNQRLLKLRWKK